MDRDRDRERKAGGPLTGVPSAGAGLGRRGFLGASVGALALPLFGCRQEDVEAFLQKQLQELTPPELQRMLARLEAGYARRFGRPVRVAATPPRERVEFGYGLDLSRCIGCRRCVYACVKENNPSRDPQIQWIRVLEMAKDRGVDFETADAYYDPATVPEPDTFYMPVQCQQCRKPPCVKTCPVGATWQEPDGIVVIDYNWCLGCRCCMAACPYGARHFNWTEPGLPSEALNADTHVLGNRPRPKGVVEKCTFCIQRVRKGRYPACVEICPVGARKFGNLLDAKSEIRTLMDQKRVFVLKGDLNTQPRFYYFYGL